MYNANMPSPQPLLSAPFNPAPSPAIRPAVGYPSPHRPPYSPSQPSFSQGPHNGFHDSPHRPLPPPPSQGYYPPPPQQGARPLPLHQQPLPPPPNGYNARPNHAYPPY
ncbi:hypothetical protein A0J61_07224 [Choanephora cucurbitarum]|uniref:Uncharacterized protein n=1 Tax=Choanephora cucurbitarum TaxID=101091 RepID=A0A1C7N6P9_9FUNG|nr:hypothetical protein A0J61_07224 [Choanephora cucurbitarum]